MRKAHSALAQLLAAQWDRPGVADVWWKCVWQILFINKKEAADDLRHQDLQLILQLVEVRRKRQPFHTYWRPSRRPRRRS